MSYVYTCMRACGSTVYSMCVYVFLSLHSLYQCTFRLYCILSAAFGVINDDDYIMTPGQKAIGQKATGKRPLTARGLGLCPQWGPEAKRLVRVSSGVTFSTFACTGSL